MIAYAKKWYVSLKQLTVRQVINACARAALENPTLVLAVMIYVTLAPSAPDVETLPGVAQGIHTIVNILGWTMLLIWTAMQFVSLRSVPDVEGHLSRVVGIIGGLLVRGILLDAALAAVRVYGTELVKAIEWVLANPQSSLVGVTAVLIVWAVFVMAPPRRYMSALHAPVAARASLAAPLRVPRDANDIHRTAVHEAGHALMYAAAKTIPADLRVTVFEEIGTHDLFRGHVTHTNPAPDVLTEGYLHWRMLMSLAGSEAEKAVLGDRADGSNGDNRDWVRDATHYLSSGFGDVFHGDPTTALQGAQNVEALNRLKKVHLEALASFFKVNDALLRELAKAIVDMKTIPRDGLSTFLERVVFTNQIPKSDL